MTIRRSLILTMRWLLQEARTTRTLGLPEGRQKDALCGVKLVSVVCTSLPSSPFVVISPNQMTFRLTGHFKKRSNDPLVDGMNDSQDVAHPGRISSLDSLIYDSQNADRDFSDNTPVYPWNRIPYNWRPRMMGSVY